jgi:mono/diheme cytochrome c family protein
MTLKRVVGVAVAVAGVGLGGTVMGSKLAAAAKLDRTLEVHAVDLPIPFPLSEAEVAALRAERLTPEAPEGTDVLAGVDLAAVARERAVARGKYLAEVRYACTECHGANLAGGVMVDDPSMGVLKGRNLTAGKGGVTARYTPADWDRLVRHGVTPAGRPAVMPSIDYVAMSDRELSDLVTFIQSQPPVDAEVPPPVLSPIGTVLVATGQFILSPDVIDHRAAHRVAPPLDTAEDYGKHITQVCAGCHRADFAGGRIPGAPPDWPAAKNLTPHADGLVGWTLDDFKRLMREGLTKSGQPVRSPMANLPRTTKHMTDRDLEAMFSYLQSLPATPTRAD